MNTLTRSLLHLASITGLLVGCSGSNGGEPGITPSVAISSPADNSSVNLPLDKQVVIDFNTNYTIKAPGTCAGAENCGHVYVLIDGTSCDLPSLPYNTLASSSPTSADFSKCTVSTGQHTITLELYDDTGTAVDTLLGNPVTTAVTITAQ
jgi:hypothetical protein